MKRNIFLSITGFETMLVGFCVFWGRNLVVDDPSDRLVHIVHHVYDVNWSIALITIGLVAMIIGLTDYSKHNAQLIMLIVLGALWCAYSFAFIVIDIHFHQAIGVMSALTVSVFLRILIEARYGRYGGGDQ